MKENKKSEPARVGMAQLCNTGKDHISFSEGGVPRSAYVMA
jgi:hypothetical protein